MIAALHSAFAGWLLRHAATPACPVCKRYAGVQIDVVETDRSVVFYCLLCHAQFRAPRIKQDTARLARRDELIRNGSYYKLVTHADMGVARRVR